MTPPSSSEREIISVDRTSAGPRMLKNTEEVGILLLCVDCVFNKKSGGIDGSDGFPLGVSPGGSWWNWPVGNRVGDELFR